MAKKVVASMQKKEAKNITKLIRMVKSEKTGAYIFKEEVMPIDQVNEIINKK